MMIDLSSRTPRIVQLATRIEQDIDLKRLRPGDPYLTTREAARMLGVSTVAASRAMQLLANRRILHRRQRSGAVIAEGVTGTTGPSLRCVHFLVHQNYLKTEGLLADGTVIGMQRELPGVDVQLNFLPGDEESVERLVAAALRSPEPEGFVLVRSSLTTQRLVRASGLPVVVYGTLYPSVQGMAWIDRDHRRVARLLAEHVLSRGHRRVLHLSRDRMLPGDQPFQEGLRQTLAEAGLSLADYSVLHLPADREAIRHAVAQVLQDNYQDLGSSPFDSAASAGTGFAARPQAGGTLPGIIAQSEPLAEGAADAVTELGLVPGRDVPIVVTQVYRAGNENPCPFPRVRTTLAPEQIGVHLGRMLSQQARGCPLERDHEILPGELQVPQVV